MQHLNPPIENYLESLVPERAAVFHEMEKEAVGSGFPHVGPQVGALLELLTKTSGANRVFELGSGFGYSAAWFLRGLTDPCKVVMTDLSEENRKKAVANIAQLGREASIEFRVGDALELLRADRDTWDIIFNDIDKKDYPRVIDLAAAKLKPGGLLISDNALWHGQVVEEGVDAATDAVRTFNMQLAKHPDFDVAILPLRDGVSVARKK